MEELIKDSVLGVMEPDMRVAVISLILLLLLAELPAASAQTEEAPSWKVEFKSEVSIHGIQVSFAIKNIDPAIYERIKAHRNAINETIIPETLVEGYKKDGHPSVFYHDPKLELDDENRTIYASFFLTGFDIVKFQYNYTTINRVYVVQTEWRLYDIEFWDGDFRILKLNFSRYFRRPIALWEKINYTMEDGTTVRALFFNNTEEWELNPICYILLPEDIAGFRVDIDTIYLEYPPTMLDKAVASPLWVLAVFLAVYGFALVKRRLAWTLWRREEREEEKPKAES